MNNAIVILDDEGRKTLVFVDKIQAVVASDFGGCYLHLKGKTIRSKWSLEEVMDEIWGKE